MQQREQQQGVSGTPSGMSGPVVPKASVPHPVTIKGPLSSSASVVKTWEPQPDFTWTRVLSVQLVERILEMRDLVGGDDVKADDDDVFLLRKTHDLEKKLGYALFC
ncbi:unnamed protein product [Notodromas monacha]|uniref:Uncharacterized protein n=1 Tax=Notodromas monacha TaxID=399045 RepID=A0A7R9GHS6_9CRUS|nr:unnamed protein product [Notodromas monacha]CAG0923124.1 unnamed protein product [Notodromas monacha]